MLNLEMETNVKLLGKEQRDISQMEIKRIIKLDMIKKENELSYIYSIISERIFPKREESTKNFIDNLEDISLIIEKRILRKISNFIVIGVGMTLLIVALISYLKEVQAWSNMFAYSFVGIIIFVIGLIIKLKESERLKNEK